MTKASGIFCLQPQVWFTVFIWSLYLFPRFSWQIHPTGSPQWIIIDFSSNDFPVMMSSGDCLHCFCVVMGKEVHKSPFNPCNFIARFETERESFKRDWAYERPSGCRSYFTSCYNGRAEPFPRAPSVLTTDGCISNKWWQVQMMNSFNVVLDLKWQSASQWGGFTARFVSLLWTVQFAFILCSVCFEISEVVLEMQKGRCGRLMRCVDITWGGLYLSVIFISINCAFNKKAAAFTSEQEMRKLVRL